MMILIEREEAFEGWTFAAVEERLIEAMRLWWRSPGEGKWPFASDAPWQWMTRSTRLGAGMVKGMDMTRLLQEDDDRETRQWLGRERRIGLSAEEVGRRDEASEWLTWIGDDARKVVVAALVQRAAGRENVDWRRVKRSIGAEIQHIGLYRRYTRSVSTITKRLNGDVVDCDA